MKLHSLIKYFLCASFFTFSSLSYAFASTTIPVPLSDAIDQLFIIGFHESTSSATSSIGTLLTHSNLGGVLLAEQDNSTTTRPIQNPAQLKKLIADLQALARTPLFISVDEEGGAVRALKKKQGFKEILHSAFSYNAIPSQVLYNDSYSAARYLQSFGINLNFAPVVDLRINPTNPVIGAWDRSFSKYAARTDILANAFIRGHTKANVITSLKHFPGHGSSKKDSHIDITDITKSYTKAEMQPFTTIAGKNKVPMVMVGHLLNTKIDPKYPASLSSAHIQTLRNTGFTGVIITDDLDMSAIQKKWSREEASVQALKAGNDMIIISFYNDSSITEYIPIRNAVLDAVQKGFLTEKEIFIKYDRVQQLKKTYSIIK